MCFYKIVKMCFLQQRFATFTTKLKKYFNKNIDGHDTIMTGGCHDDQVISAARQACERQPILIPSANYALEYGHNN